MEKFIELNFPNFINTSPLPYSQALFPLYEAISNSLDAIKELFGDEPGGLIELTIYRKAHLDLSPDEEAPIQSIKISDNGIGFTRRNFNAFRRVSTARKISLGGKGMGRLTWLKVFDHAEINSFFKENGNIKHLSFEFVCANEAIKDLEVDEVSDPQENLTEITLHDCKAEYEGGIPKRSVTLAKKIITHFLPKFMLPDIPEIVIHEEGKPNISLNLLFTEEMIEDSQRNHFKIDKWGFDVVHVRTKYDSNENNRHRIYYIADGRVVNDETFSHEDLRDVPERLADSEGNENYIYTGFVESDFLNEHVNQTRDDFTILEDENGQLFKEPTKEQIREKVYKLIKDFLRDYIEKTRLEKEKRIEEYITQSAPEYLYLLKTKREVLESISLQSIRKGRLEEELHRIHLQVKSKVHEKANDLLGIPDGEISIEEYQEKFDEIVEVLDPSGKAELTNYIIYRHIVLELIKKALGLQSNGKHKREDVIHGYICPPRVSSEDIGYQNHNLWIIDERLGYNSYLSSDQPFSKIPYLEIESNQESRKRPDIFSITLATIEPDSKPSPYRTLDVIEFKRPMRDDYSTDENPISQVYDYLQIIRNNNAKTLDDRPVNMISGGIIYCHIVCDITKNLKEFLTQYDYSQIGELDWYVKFHDKYNAYIEVKGFDFMVETAYQRNRVFFDKLGIQDNK